ncbi:FadR/GntR family transcriptional regulator [Tsukamurella soli]|uniref:FadR/GntR family transcriptional regulator n=1 Tax=Tsukamurella soli TaxID=644556 RepID=A0ABP8J3S9_9ACTN
MSVWSGIDITGESIPERLSAQIAAMIDSGRVPPGAHLPSERALMTLLGASRISVRQALQDLELRGYLIRRPRSGRIVAPPGERERDGSIFGVMTQDQRAIREVMDLRSVVEPPIAERAAMRHRVAQLHLLRDPLEAAEAALLVRPMERDTLQRYDVLFHLAIAKVTYNPMLERLIAETDAWMAPTRQVAFQTERRMRESVAAHRRIYDAIARRDAAGAGAAMHDHLTDVLAAIEPLTAPAPAASTIRNAPANGDDHGSARPAPT